MTEQSLLPRITRDISDGLIVLDKHGTVQFVNPAAKKLLHAPELAEGEKYAALMMNEEAPENDGFHQFLLDAVYDKEKPHTGALDYTRRDGSRCRFRVTSSYLFNDDMSEKVGVVIQFSDETDISLLRRKNEDSARVFVALMSFVCVWVFNYALWDQMGQPIASSILSYGLELFGAFIFFFIWRFTSITFADMGLQLRGTGRYIAIDAAFSAAALLLLIAVKLVLLRLSPDMFQKQAVFNMAYFDWSCRIYPLSVVMQEFFTRGVVHESVKRILPGKYAVPVAIIVSSLLFGALHIHKGLAFMTGAMLLLGLFGVIYEKQKSIWGLCIPHYVLGLAICLLFELA